MLLLQEKKNDYQVHKYSNDHRNKKGRWSQVETFSFIGWGTRGGYVSHTMHFLIRVQAWFNWG